MKNESADIIRMLCTAFDAFVAPELQETNKPLLPADKVKEIEAMKSFVLFEDRQFQIHKNLSSALSVLVTLAIRDLFWIDAMRIDYDNAIQRGFQVALMGDVSASASEVRVWPGPESRCGFGALYLYNAFTPALRKYSGYHSEDDLRDKVYAADGAISRFSLPSHTVYETIVSYADELTVEGFDIELTCCILYRVPPLSIFFCVEDPSERRLKGLSSWVPDSSVVSNMHWILPRDLLLNLSGTIAASFLRNRSVSETQVCVLGCLYR